MLKLLADKSTTLLAAFGTIYYVIKIVIRKCSPCQQRLQISLPLKCLSPCKGQRHVGEKSHIFSCHKTVPFPQTLDQALYEGSPFIAYRMSVGTQL